MTAPDTIVRIRVRGDEVRPGDYVETTPAGVFDQVAGNGVVENAEGEPTVSLPLVGGCYVSVSTRRRIAILRPVPPEDGR